MSILGMSLIDLGLLVVSAWALLTTALIFRRVSKAGQ